MDNSTLAILLLMLAQAVVIAEVFLPSGGVLTILAVITGLASLFFGHQAWFSSDNAVFWIFVASSVITPLISVSLAFYLLPRTPFGRQILLDAPTSEEVTPYADHEIHLKQLVGQVGRADTLLAPGGFVSVGGERHHCVTEGGRLIDRGERIEVLAVNGNRLMVRPYVERESSKPVARDETKTEVVDAQDSDPDGMPSLDFEIPESEMDE